MSRKRINGILCTLSAFVFASLASSCGDGSDEGVTPEPIGPCAGLLDDARCDDMDACTENDRCIAGVCTGEALDCSARDSDCSKGVCEEGKCVAEAINESETCRDDATCTTDNVCKDGYCRGTKVDCSHLATEECQVGVCTERGCEVEAASWASDCRHADEWLCDNGHMCLDNGCVNEGCGAQYWTENATTKTGSVGDTKGDAYEYTCSDGTVLVGVRGFTGTHYAQGIISGFQGICGQVVASHPRGRWMRTRFTTNLPDSGVIGRFQNGDIAAWDLTCEDSEILVGIFANTAATGSRTNALSAIRLECAKFELEQVTFGSGRIAPLTPYRAEATIGRFLPDSATHLACPEASVVNGVFGHTDLVLDQLGLVCATGLLKFKEER